MKWKMISAVLVSYKRMLTTLKNTNKTDLLPYMLYGIDSWATMRKHTYKIQITETCILRRMNGKTRKNKIKNDMMRKCK